MRTLKAKALRHARATHRAGGYQYLGERRKTVRSTMRPTLANLNWAAGFIEGEGSFKHRGPGCCGKIQMAAFQLEREPLEKLLALFGGSLRPSHGGLVWTASGTRGHGVAMTLYPLLSARRQGQIRGKMPRDEDKGK